MGMGAMTGRGMGFCAGYDRPGYANMMPGGGKGSFYGRGRGCRNGGRGGCQGFAATGRPGWTRFGDYGAPYGNWAPYSQADPEMEKQALKTQADFLQSELDQIKKRLEDIESEKKV
ncbi:MAG: DUF5320 domain-containing protein [Syntrophales bacterium]|jgi:hypothetical protein|nr:DUF5320 domain-containing protein [Syntrophales bacterium]